MTTENPNLSAALARLDALTDWERRPRKSMRVGLEPARDLAARLGHPQKTFRAVHVGGTKGKGSVSALIEAGLVAAGVAVGRYGSPHVEHVTERVSLMGRDVDAETLARALTAALAAYEAARREGTAAADATWFDIMTLAAFLLFREAGVAWAVVEVGIGGRLDSTNIVDGEVAVVTNIGLEHTEILGSTRAAIAAEKAGIVKPGGLVVTALAPDDEAGRVLLARAHDVGARVVVAAKGATIDASNIALAAAALDALGRDGVVDASGAPLGPALLASVADDLPRLPGRMERGRFAGAPVVLDGAHVPFNIEAVLADLAHEPSYAGPCVAVVALARDKDAEGFLAALAKRCSAIVCTTVAARSRPGEELHAIAGALGIASEVEPDATRAFLRGVELARESRRWALVTGSLYLVGEVRGLVEREPASMAEGSDSLLI